MSQKSERRKHFAKVEPLLVHEKEHGRTNYDSCVEINRAAYVLDVAVLLESCKLLRTCIIDTLEVKLFKNTALYGPDPLDDLRQKLDALVGKFLSLVAEIGNDVVGIVLHSKQGRHRDVTNNDHETEL
jgi:hypothetical protein